MIIVVSGSIGRFPIGGNAWYHLQYLLGLRELGHDVFYLEECGQESWVYNWETEELTTELEYPTAYVHDCLGQIGFGSRWIYRAGDRWAGMMPDEFSDVCSQADLLILLSAPLELWRAEYMCPRQRVFIDTDPGFIQMNLANGDPQLGETVARCERLFTIGQRIGASDCIIPTADRDWLKTVLPISLSHWPWAGEDYATHFTSVMQWRSYSEVVYEGVSYGNKDREFPKFIDLPRLTAQPLQIALTGADPLILSDHGWDVVAGWIQSQTPSSYRTYIQQSRAEFGVAKHGYVAMQGGWFGDRSVCYLASGRPVLVQDTGLRNWLPTGKGILTFSDAPEALRGIESINADYEGHRGAARLLAEEFFAAPRVLTDLLERCL